jgi:hypothetical protein
MIAFSYKTKKALKESIGQALRYVETSFHSDEFKRDGVLSGVGPSPYLRKWHANVTMEDGLIKKVT